MRSKVIAPGCAAGGVFLCLSGTTLAAFTTIGHEVTFEPAGQQVHFSLHFSEPPDFLAVDEHNEYASAFQVFIDPEPSPDGFDYDQTRTLIRGIGIPPSNSLSVWDFNGVEGFGELRGKVPIDTIGNRVAFAIALDTLGDEDGLFDYRIESYSFGEMTDLRDGTTNVIPLPSAVWTGASMLALGGALQLRRRLKS